MRIVSGIMAATLACAPLLAQPGAPGAGPAATPAAPYRINPGDEIEIYVWGEERLQRTVKVLPDGTFSFPLAGRIEAAGKLPADIEAAVSNGLRKQYRDQVPEVTASVRATTGMQFSVAGKVRTQGTFSPGRNVNVLEALALAGGPADFANLNNVVILRKTNGALTKIDVRLADVLRGNVSSNLNLPQIEVGDTVIVP